MGIQSACNSNTHSREIYLLSHGQSQNTRSPSHKKYLCGTLEKSGLLQVGMFSRGKGRTDETSMAIQRMPSTSAKQIKEEVAGGQSYGANQVLLIKKEMQGIGKKYLPLMV